MRVVEAGPGAFALRPPENIGLYAAEYRLDPEAAREREAIVRRHLGRKRFSAFFALSGNGLLGFACGYAGGPGGYWYNLVSQAMPPRSGRRGRGSTSSSPGSWWRPPPGDGGSRRLCGRLLAGWPEPVALLTVREKRAPALALYRKRGSWVLLDHFRFAPGGERFFVMGKRLPV